MPDNENTVDIDNSGPEVEVQLPIEQKEEDKTFENEVNKDEKVNQNNNESVNTDKKSDEQFGVRDEVRAEGGVVEKSSDEKGSDKQQDNSKSVEEYSEGVKKRIAKLTKKMREAERQREEAIAFANRIKKERDAFETKSVSLDKNYAVEMENRISGQLAAAQAKLAAARTNEDSKAEVEALTAISQLGYEQGKLAELKTAQQMQETAEKEKPVQRQQTQPTQPAPRDPKAEAWAEKNEWFGKDNAMTYTAFDLHRKLTEEEGMDPQSDEYYEEVDKRIRLEFPHKFDKPVEEKTTSKPTQTVASATRSPKTGSNNKTVRLTSSQVAIARKLRVPLEEYAKQLMNTKEE
jgi:hypothetical protein